MSDQVVVYEIPNCDVCRRDGQPNTPAYADAKLGAGLPWAYVCERHFRIYMCALGTGRGQRLVLRENPAPDGYVGG